jgi:hypothetical protein
MNLAVTDYSEMNLAVTDYKPQSEMRSTIQTLARCDSGMRGVLLFGLLRTIQRGLKGFPPNEEFLAIVNDIAHVFKNSLEILFADEGWPQFKSALVTLHETKRLNLTHRITERNILRWPFGFFPLANRNVRRRSLMMYIRIEYWEVLKNLEAFCVNNDDAHFVDLRGLVFSHETKSLKVKAKRQHKYYKRFLPLICRILPRLPVALLSLVTCRILYS